LFATKVNRVCFCFYFRFLLFGFCYNTRYFSPYYAYNIYYFICLIAIIFMVFSVPLMATLIYPLNIHLHVATNFACVGFEERQSTKGKINYHHCDIFICQRNFPRVAFLRSLKGHYTRCSPCRMININVLEKTLAIWPGISLHFGWRKNKKRK